ncbi:NFX1-type zinc finger-containing protein 1-like [Haemaphysalis longicornis]
MQRLKQRDRSPISNPESLSSSASSGSSDDDDGGGPFDAPLPRFGDQTVAKYTSVQPGWRDPVRPGRNCHTYSKGAGFAPQHDGDSSLSPTTRSRSWRHVPRTVDVYALSRLLEGSDTETLFTLVLMGKDLDALLENATLDCSALNLLLELLVKACLCPQTAHLTLLLATVAANEKFLRNVEQQLVCRRRLSVFWNQFVVPLVSVVEKGVRLLPREGKTNLCGIATALLDAVNSSLQEKQPVDVKIVEAVESIGTQLASKLDFRRVVSRPPHATFPGDGDPGKKPSALPADFVLSSHLTDTAQVVPSRPATTSDYLNVQYVLLRQLFLAPLKRALSALQLYPTPAETSGIAVYTKVKIGPPICTSNGVGNKVNFSVLDSRACESRLRPGSMVCISMDGFQTVFLGVVLWRSFKDKTRGHMVASFVESRRLESLASSRGFAMTECPEFYENYAGVFSVMKEFESTQLPLPFERYVVEGHSDVVPPAYVNDNTLFDMKALFKKSVFVRPHKDRDWPNCEETEFDRYQYDALQTVLSRAVTLVEGMPGTGKTYVASKLVSLILDNMDNLRKGPVLVVSKDKESISTLLAHFEGVLDEIKVLSGDGDLSEMSKQLLASPPNSSALESTSQRLMRQHNADIENFKSRAKIHQGNLRRRSSGLLSESELRSVMTDKHYKSLFFTLASGAEDKLRDWLLADNKDVASRFSTGLSTCLSEDEVCYITDVWALDMESRYRLYNYWKEHYFEKKSLEWLSLVDKFRTALLLREEVEEKLRFDSLRGQKIVAVTVSSLIKLWKVLREVKPPVIIVQDSRLVPEPFMLPILTLDPHHILFFSDTQNIFDAVDEFTVGCGSLFDRLAEQGVACCHLLGQYQLIPQVVRILEAFKTKKFLKRYEFHANVTSILGVSKSVQFVDHSHCYDRDTIIACALEAEFLASLAKYLLLQGYHTNQLVVYAPTEEQAEIVRSNMCGLQEQPLVTTVDKAKGRRSDIVLASFSCPNTTHDIEALSSSYYHAIASSTQGLYFIGNMTYLAERTRTWKQVVPVLHSEGVVGPLELTCQLHPEKTTAVVTAKDFAEVLDGGCSTPCNAMLPCGHPCPKNCHLKDRDHQGTTCTKPCKKLLSCEHLCKALCGEPCPEQCDVMVNALSPCDHVVRVPCAVVRSAHEVRIRCTEVCGKKISRAVRCARQCRDCFLEGTHLGDDVYFEEEPAICSSCQIM